ncbi:hypothetical protein NDU88_012624 [Pleurodeles waltl]|uniref:Uncharacterized protein n=1 Tax=Pleurodeles waltl TaxID=8319 RepID=A0AAV7R3B3_PLEWA|nr:hypothetical protein NDU88_012624 [Pleurodeles waltl]
MEAPGWFYDMTTLAWCTRPHRHGGAGQILRQGNSSLVHAASSAWRRWAGTTAWQLWPGARGLIGMKAPSWFYCMATLTWCTRPHQHGDVGLVLHHGNSSLVHAASSAWRRRAGLRHGNSSLVHAASSAWRHWAGLRHGNSSLVHAAWRHQADSTVRQL